MNPFSKILVPIDFSEHSENATRVAADLAQRYAAGITLIHVYEPVQYALPEGYVMLTLDQLTRLTAVLNERLASAERSLKKLNVPHVESRLLQGIVSSEIVAFAKEQGSDLIVMGTHGRTGIKHALLGSVAERIVRTAPCPVLTVKASGPAGRC